jgi:poly(hydroxyalkanoate) granule-associated protein
LLAQRALAQTFGGIVAKLKKTVRSRKSAASKNNASELQAKAEQMSRSLVESAQQIWMAGVGAFTRAQGEGSKLFEALVKEGMNIEQHTRKLATGKVDAVRDAVEDRVGVVRERATDTWDRLEKVFEERVQRALNRLGVPGREELSDLVGRVDALTAELKKVGGKPAATKTAAKSGNGARKVATKRGAKPVAKAPVAKRKAAKKALPKAAHPVAP